MVYFELLPIKTIFLLYKDYRLNITEKQFLESLILSPNGEYLVMGDTSCLVFFLLLISLNPTLGI